MTVSHTTTDLQCYCIVQEYKAHDKSRESIEMALDEILKQKMKIRHKYGFKPPKSGRRTDVEGDPTVCFMHTLLLLAVEYAALFFSCANDRRSHKMT